MDTFVPEDTRIKHRSNLIPPDYRACIIAGRSRSGKTTLLPSILNKLHKFDHLFLYVKNIHQPVYEHIIKNIDPDTKVHVYESLKPKPILRRADELKNCLHSVVIIDDFTDKKELESMNFLFTAGRHYHISVYVLLQNWFLAPLDMRVNSTECMLFACDNASYVFTKLPEYIPRKDLKELYKHVQNSSTHDFLYICMDAELPPAFRIRLGFDKFIKDEIEDIIN